MPTFLQIPSLETPDVLQFTELETFNTKECAKRYENIPQFRGAVQKGNLCTIDKKNGGSCNGDSGNLIIIKSI